MADKTIYMRPGETLEIRHLIHEDYDRNAKSWQDQARPQSDLIRINGPHSITPARMDLECRHWKTWSTSPSVKATDSECSACGGTGRMGPFFPGGLSTTCGNCVDPSPQTNLRGEPKRWLLEEHLPGGAIRWHCFEHEHQCRARGIASEHEVTVTPLFAATTEGQP